MIKKKTHQICQDFRNNACKKTANECAHAHPPPHCPIDTENSLVTVCVDFIKGKCARETCKYFHPPEHLVAQLKKQKIANNAVAAAAAAAAAFTNTSAFPFFHQAPSHPHQSMFNPYLGLASTVPLNSNFHTTTLRNSHLAAAAAAASSNTNRSSFNQYRQSFSINNTSSPSSNTNSNNLASYLMPLGLHAPTQQQFPQHPLLQFTEIHQANLNVSMANILNRNTTTNNNNNNNSNNIKNISPNSSNSGSSSSGSINATTSNSSSTNASKTASFMGNNNNNSNLQQTQSNYNAQFSAPAITAAAANNVANVTAGSNSSVGS